MKEITFKESLALPDRVYIDVRSPGEYGEDHVAGSVNIPLFDNEERKEVGTLYRMAGREDAIVRGTQIVGGKLKEMVESVLKYGDRRIIVMCARGGMRSSSLVSLLDSLGMAVYKLADGYKGYRRHVNERMKTITFMPPIFILQGLTGSGKTELIRSIPNSMDLEEMAGHRSSVFGGIGLSQKTQKRFESLIMERLTALDGAPFCVIEGESRKIGDLHIPDSLYELMKAAPSIFIDADMERRVDIIFNEYNAHCNDVNIPSILAGLRQKLGNKNMDQLMAFYSEGNIRDFIKGMLEKYYDPLYRHSLDKKEYIAKINNASAHDTLKEIGISIESFLKNSASCTGKRQAV